MDRTVEDRCMEIKEAFLKLGVTMEEACHLLEILGDAARQVPFPSGEELRLILLLRWKRDYGWLRFFCLEYWRTRFITFSMSQN